MSDKPHKLPVAKPKRPPHHVTATPYIIGFLLSLVFTVVTYYLVVYKSFSAHILLGWIIAFAFLQMAIQLIFFLHLGREKKPHFNLFFLTSTGGIILLVVVGSIWIMSHLTHHMTAIQVTDKIAQGEAVHQIEGAQAGTCPATTGKDHNIMLMDNLVTPVHIDAHLCDTITFQNMDSTTRQLTFGPLGQAETYAGDAGETVYAGHNTVLTLTELGTHQFHEHTLAQMSGDFTVTK